VQEAVDSVFLSALESELGNEDSEEKA
jgi:hypothetical protein